MRKQRGTGALEWCIRPSTQQHGSPNRVPPPVHRDRGRPACSAAWPPRCSACSSTARIALRGVRTRSASTEHGRRSLALSGTVTL